MFLFNCLYVFCCEFWVVCLFFAVLCFKPDKKAKSLRFEIVILAQPTWKAPTSVAFQQGAAWLNQSTFFFFLMAKEAELNPVFSWDTELQQAFLSSQSMTFARTGVAKVWTWKVFRSTILSLFFSVNIQLVIVPPFQILTWHEQLSPFLSALTPAPTYQLGTTSAPSADAPPSHKEISHAGELLPLPANVSILATGNKNNFTSRPAADTASEDSGSPPKSPLRHLSKVNSDWSLLYELNCNRILIPVSFPRACRWRANKKKGNPL